MHLGTTRGVTTPLLDSDLIIGDEARMAATAATLCTLGCSGTSVGPMAIDPLLIFKSGNEPAPNEVLRQGTWLGIPANGLGETVLPKAKDDDVDVMEDVDRIRKIDELVELTDSS